MQLRSYITDHICFHTVYKVQSKVILKLGVFYYLVFLPFIAGWFDFHLYNAREGFYGIWY